LDELREEIAHLKAERDEDRRHRPGPVMTSVLAGFLVVGGFVILVTADDSSRDLGYATPFPVWLVLTAATGLAATLIFDNRHRLPQKPRNRMLRFGIGLGGLVLALFVALVILRAAVGEAQYATGGDVGMLTVSLIVGAVVALSLRAMGMWRWRQRLSHWWAAEPSSHGRQPRP
jgi:hypothetical protein